MKNYIFLTEEGLTLNNDGLNTNNFQVLGTFKGENPEEAFKNLKRYLEDDFQPENSGKTFCYKLDQNYNSKENKKYFCF